MKTILFILTSIIIINQSTGQNRFSLESNIGIGVFGIHKKADFLNDSAILPKPSMNIGVELKYQLAKKTSISSEIKYRIQYHNSRNTIKSNTTGNISFRDELLKLNKLEKVFRLYYTLFDKKIKIKVVGGCGVAGIIDYHLIEKRRSTYSIYTEDTKSSIFNRDGSTSLKNNFELYLTSGVLFQINGISYQINIIRSISNNQIREEHFLRPNVIAGMINKYEFRTLGLNFNISIPFT